LNFYKKKVEELSGLLIENENILELLQVQTKLLKGEIRNYERHNKREDNYKNLEYIKNIILKYIQTHNEQLIPVICNLLQFSPEENNLLRNNLNRPPSAPVSPRNQTSDNHNGNGRKLTGFWVSFITFILF